MRDLHLSEVNEVQEYKKVTPGAYVCRILSVSDVADKEYLKIEYDIADGEHKGYYQELYNSKGFWGASFIRSYKEKAKPFFKAFITAVENSNNGYKFDNDESKLFGKVVGLVIGEEEYTKNDGSIGTRLYVDKTRSVAQVKKGDIEIPAIKRLKQDDAATAFGGTVVSEEIPF